MIFNQQIYKDMDLLSNELDALCQKYPDIFPVWSWRKIKFYEEQAKEFNKMMILQQMKFEALAHAIGEQLFPAIKNAEIAVKKFGNVLGNFT